MRYRHIVWDFDGTLFDTYPIMARAMQGMLEERGIEEPLEDIIAHMTVSMGEALRHYERLYHLPENFYALYKLRRRAMEEEIRPYPCVPSLLRSICQAGGRNYVFTHRGESTEYFLKKFAIADCFTDFVTSRQSLPRKPAPDGMLYLIRKHDLHPEKILMIGDRPLDILAGKNAGTDACFFSERGESCDAADYTVHNLESCSEIIFDGLKNRCAIIYTTEV